MGRGGDEVKMLNDTILLAKDLPSLLEIIDQKVCIHNTYTTVHTYI
jgi:PII-like signaling protein